MNRQCYIFIGPVLLALFGCNEQPREKQPAQTARNGTPMVKARHKLYENQVDLTGRDIISPSGASRAAAKELFPFLAEPQAMKEREFSTEELTAYNGEIADEVHEFNNATQGRSKIKRLLLRDGRVIELTVGAQR